MHKKVQVFVEGYGDVAAGKYILRNLPKRKLIACIMARVERYKNLYFCDCA